MLRYQDLLRRALYPGLAVYTDRLAQRQSFRDSVPVAQTIADKVVRGV